ncbi:hypothetical protein L3V83_04575 [Thiotrichales bacterium 19X7-9]|nr:hypothetical protein [Thiotrichales bacterium 19X7-9]
MLIILKKTQCFINFLILSILLVSYANANTTIGIIQYNVKGLSKNGNSNIWGNKNPTYRNNEINFINQKINDVNAPVDFIALEEAVVNSSAGASPLLNTLALSTNNHQYKWQTLRNEKHLSSGDYDEAQITYDSNRWEKISAMQIQQTCQGTNTCKGYFTIAAPDHVRPYYMAYFKGIATDNLNKKVLFIALHFPHYTSHKQWDTSSFIKTIQQTVGANIDLSKVNIILAGDMNEIGPYPASQRLNTLEVNANQTFQDYLGVFKKSNIQRTCCHDSKYGNAFDQIAVNNGGSIIRGSVINPNQEAYLYDSEEHKAVYALVSIN